MKFANKILTAGILIIVLPFLGLPTPWKNFFFFLLGAWLCILYFSIRRGSTKMKRGNVSNARKTHSQAISFVENKPVEAQTSSIKPTIPTINEENQQV